MAVDTKPQYVFKVTDHQQCSAMSDVLVPTWRVQYWVDSYVIGNPPSKLMAFETFEQARRFADRRTFHKVWLAEAIGVTKGVFLTYVDSPYLADFWQGLHKNNDFPPCVNLREIKREADLAGTVFCDQIKLVEELKR